MGNYKKKGILMKDKNVRQGKQYSGVTKNTYRVRCRKMEAKPKYKFKHRSTRKLQRE